MDLDTERMLVEQCRRQNYEAFGKLVDAYQNRIFGFVKRMVRNQDEALDVTQEVFIRAFQGFENFDGRASLRTWLFRIANNLCIDRSRKYDRAPVETSIDGTEDAEPIEFADVRWNPETLVIDDELARVVEAGIAGLSEKLRTVLLLHDREDMAYEEIATMLSLPIGTVKSRLFLARSHLQSHVRAHWDREVQVNGA